MTLVLRGKASLIQGYESEYRSEVLRIKTFDQVPEHSADAALVRSAEQLSYAQERGFKKIVGIGVLSDELDVPVNFIALPSEFDYLSSGDILGVEPETRQVRSLFRNSSIHNSFLITERCNHNCLMCSQPPRRVDDRWLIDEIQRALPLIDRTTPAFTFTGGEPLSDWQDFIQLLTMAKQELPNTSVHVLTNGRAFAKNEIANAWANVRHPSLMAGIPIYASVDTVHDYIVQARGALDETVMGILKLKERGQRVEVRLVLHALTAPIVAATCRWFAKNIPFVDHVALMGLENTGFAIGNAEKLWIDPIDYAAELAEGVEALLAANMRVSVYNLPRCVLPRSIWSNTVQSISDWKNGYVSECVECVEKPNCSGFFTSGRPRMSRGVRAFRQQVFA